MILQTPVYVRTDSGKKIYLIKSGDIFNWSDIDANSYPTQDEAINAMKVYYPHSIFCDLPKKSYVPRYPNSRR
jgi:1,2-phenylacetyl-CoA epoxidase PaaB subunit